MSRLNRRQLNMVKDLLCKRKDRLSLTPTWQRIAQLLDLEFEYWAAGSKWVELDEPRLQAIRDAVRTQEGIDLLTQDLDGDRLRVSALVSNEKLASEKPEQGYVLIRPWGFALFPDAPLWSFRLPIEQALLILTKYQVGRVYVVENLDVFDAWQPELQTPDCERALLLFNGSHEQYSAAGVKAFCAQSTVPIMAFMDLDPAGIQLAHKLPQVSAMLVPEALDALLSEPHINHQADFEKQHNQRRYLQTVDLAGWKELTEFVLRNRLSIKQQHLLARGNPLIPLAL